MKKLLKKKGYTLIELMIVIAIIGIMASIMIPNFVRARAEAEMSACESNERNLANALDMYAVDNNGNYPTSSGGPGGMTLLTPNYMPGLPVCPTDQSQYYYETISTPIFKFTISCQGDFTMLLGPTNGGPPGSPHYPKYSLTGGTNGGTGNIHP